MGDFRWAADFTWKSCWKCGIGYAVPSKWLEHRQKDHREFWCPNGHGAAFLAPKDDPAERERRQKLVREVHDAEQREAREADAAEQGSAPPDMVRVEHRDGDVGFHKRETAEDIAQALAIVAAREAVAQEVADPKAIVIPPVTGRHHRCPVCGHEFRTRAGGDASGHFRRHMYCRHKVDGDDFRAALRRGLALAGKGVPHE